MFLRFFVNDKCNKHSLLNPLKSFKVLKGYISNRTGSKISPRGFKKSNSLKNEEIKKIRKNLKNEKSKSNGNFDGKDTLPQSNFKKYWLAGSLVTYGLINIMVDKNRIKNLPLVDFDQFEQQYLLHGEVRTVNLLGFATSSVTGCVAEAVLYPDNSRTYQRIAIAQPSGNIRIVQSIKNKEKELKIDPKEAVLSSVSYSELIICIGLILGVSSFVPSLIRKYYHHSPPFKDEFKFGSDRFNIQFKVVKSDKTKNASATDIPGATEPLKQKSKTQKPPVKPFDIFSQVFIDTSTEQYDQKMNIKFKDVAGLHSAKTEVKEFLDYLNNPSKFIRLGARLPRGAMLLGPPGCGKTLLIKALANESNVPFYYKAGSEFVDMIGGVGAKRMRQLFSSARNNSPAIIFIDEIDAIGKKRATRPEEGGDADQTLNQLLVEMDGMDSNAGVVVFAATNRPDVLDRALVRPGRLDRHILIDLPVLEERKEMFNLYLSKYKNKLESPVHELKDKLALQTPGMSGADISNLCNEAALTAAKLDYNSIKDECFDMALERLIAGSAKKNNFLSESERKLVAYHEAGHVLVGWNLEYADPILKVSIVPRTNASLGFSQLNTQERYLLTTDILADKIAVLLGGRAAESIKFNRVSSGAHDDLRKVKNIAFSMIREWGMSEKVGHVSFQISEEEDAYGLVPYSKTTQSLIEQEASSIITENYKRAESLLLKHVAKLELLAQELLKREVLVYNDIELLIGPRPNSSVLRARDWGL